MDTTYLAPTATCEVETNDERPDRSTYLDHVQEDEGVDQLKDFLPLNTNRQANEFYVAIKTWLMM